MKLIEIIHFAFDGIFRRKLKVFLIVLAYVLALLLLAVCLLPKEILTYSYKCADKSLKSGSERTGIIDVKWGSKNNDIFIDSISEIDGIAASGTIYGGVETNIKEIGENVPLLILCQNAWDVYDFKLSKGQYISNDRPEDESIGFVYLGSDYNDIPVGTQIKINPNFIMKVMGILEDNSVCLSEYITSTEITESKIVSMDSMVLMEYNKNKDGSYTNINLFSLENNADKNEVYNRIYKKAAELGVETTVSTVDGAFENEKKEYKDILDLILQMTVIVMLVIIVIQACIQVVDIMENMDIYGVLISNGASFINIGLIIAVEGIIISIVSYGIASFIGWALIGNMFVNVGIREMLSDIYRNYVLFRMAFASAIITFLSVIVPFIYITKKKPTELIGKL